MTIQFRRPAHTYKGYRGIQQSGVFIWKSIRGNGRIRGPVVSVVPRPDGTCTVKIRIEEFDHGFNPRGPMPDGVSIVQEKTPALRLGNPANYVMTFTCHQDALTVYNLGKTIRVDSRLGVIGKIEGVIIKQEALPNGPYWKVTVECPPQPAREEETLNCRSTYSYITSREAKQYSEDLLARMKALGVPKKILTTDPTHVTGIKRTGEMSFPINWAEETTMKIFDAVVVKVDDKGEYTEIVQVISPFLAKDITAAQTAVTVDYAAANKIAGKDLTGLRFVVRNFQGSY